VELELWVGPFGMFALELAGALGGGARRLAPKMRCHHHAFLLGTFSQMSPHRLRVAALDVVPLDEWLLAW